MARWHSRALDLLVIMLGLGLLVAYRSIDFSMPLASLALFVGVVAAELIPITIKRGSRTWTDITVSNALLAMLAITAGVAACVVAFAIAEFITQARLRMKLWTAMFNLAVVAIVATAAKTTFTLFTHTHGDIAHPTPIVVGSVVMAAAAVTSLNFLIQMTTGAVADNERILVRLHQGVGLVGLIFTLEIGMIPVIVAALHLWPPLLLCVGVPLALARHATASSAEVVRQAMRDTNTGLPNRRSIEDEFAAWAPRHQRAAVLVVKVQNRDAMIRTLGHEAGDQLLRDITARLQTVTRQDTDLVGHIEGDKFAVIIPLSGEVGETVIAVDMLGQRLLAALRNDFRLGGVQVSALAAVGAALYPDHGTTALELLPKAESAIETDLPDLVHIHDPADEVDSVEQLSLLGQLRDAIESGQLEVHYQPKVDASTEIVLGAEALVRWQHPQRGLLFPNSFVDLAETTGLVVPMTWVVLDQALAQAHRWLTRHHWALRVSVNLAAAALVAADTPQRVEQALAKHKVPAELLILEVTESSLIKNPEQARSNIEKLRGMGVRISIDDYGTGYSSLAYLQHLHADELKIDRVFVKNLGAPDNANDLAIVETTITLGKRLKMQVVAEGVESRIERDILEQAGCDVIQGFLYSKPLPADGLTTWLLGQTVKPWVPNTPSPRHLPPRPRPAVAAEHSEQVEG